MLKFTRVLINLLHVAVTLLPIAEWRQLNAIYSDRIEAYDSDRFLSAATGIGIIYRLGDRFLSAATGTGIIYRLVIDHEPPHGF